MNHLFLNWTALDYVILAVIFFSVIISFFRGFLREAISLITWFFAFFFALKFAPDVSSLFHSFLSSSPKARYIVAAAIIFIITLILGAIVNKLVHGLIDFSGLVLIDKVLGLIFGAARGVLFVTIILLVVQASPFKNSAWAKNSQVSPCFQTLVAYFAPLLPKEVKAVTAWIAPLTNRN